MAGATHKHLKQDPLRLIRRRRSAPSTWWHKKTLSIRDLVLYSTAGVIAASVGIASAMVVMHSADAVSNTCLLVGPAVGVVLDHIIRRAKVA